MQNTSEGPLLAIYHSNMKGSGCAAKFRLHTSIGENDGAIILQLAHQTLEGIDFNSTKKQFPKFDWAGGTSLRLDANDVAKFIMVFRGECESINCGVGIVKRYDEKPDLIHEIYLSHEIARVSGYRLVVNKHESCEDMETFDLFLSQEEAIILCESFSGSLRQICFGG